MAPPISKTTAAAAPTATQEDLVSITLKAIAHLRLPIDTDDNNDQNQNPSILIAGAGVLDPHTSDSVQQQQTTENQNVMFYFREAQKSPPSRRIKPPLSETCPLPPNLSFHSAALLVYPLLASLSILKRELGFSLETLKPDDEAMEDLPKVVLILGGETAIGGMLIQLLRIILPSSKLLVACRAAEEDGDQPPEDFQGAVRPFCRESVELGARYAIDGEAEDLMAHLEAAVGAYGGGGDDGDGEGGFSPIKMTFDTNGEIARRPELLGLCEARGIVDCSYAAVREGLLARGSEIDRVSITELGKFLEGRKVRVPAASEDLFVEELG